MDNSKTACELGEVKLAAEKPAIWLVARRMAAKNDVFQVVKMGLDVLLA